MMQKFLWENKAQNFLATLNNTRRCGLTSNNGKQSGIIIFHFFPFFFTVGLLPSMESDLQNIFLEFSMYGMSFRFFISGLSPCFKPFFTVVNLAL